MNANSFERPGISPEFLAAAGVHQVKDPEPQLRIPYFWVDGQPTGHWRSRLLKARPDGQKYDQAPGSGSHVYFTHRVLEPSSTLYLTEGEFKTLSLREAGYQVFGLPGLHCYTRDVEGMPRLLPGILEAVELVKPEKVCFIGDSDTVTNLEYFRSGHFLAQAIPAAVELLQLPLGGPKGIDDLRGSLNGEFPSRLSEEESKALAIDPGSSFLVPALIQLEAAGGTIQGLPPMERERHISRVVHMAALARMSTEEPQVAIERFCDAAHKATKLTKPAFEKSVEDKIKVIRGSDGEREEDDQTDELEVYFNSIKPWPAAVPLSEILWENFDLSEAYIATQSHVRVLAVTWTAHTYPYRESPYLPMLIFTSPEEMCGKTNFLHLVARTAYRPLTVTNMSPGSIHRVVNHYRGTVIVDEAKSIAEDPMMVSFLNSGFNNSGCPVDSTKIPRWNVDTGTVDWFSANFPKAMAGIGSFLEAETISRSLVIMMQRALPEEEKKLIDFAFCTLDKTLPVARKLTAFWTEEMRGKFRSLATDIMLEMPAALRGRNKQKFCPLYAVGKLAGPEWYEMIRGASLLSLQQPETVDRSLGHQLLCDLAKIVIRERARREKGLQSLLVVIPKTGRDFITTAACVKALLAMPEAPWRAYGKTKRMLDANGMFWLLRPYELGKSERVWGPKEYLRGLYCDRLLEVYRRFQKVNESSTTSDDGGDDPDPGSGGSGPSEPSPAPDTPSASFSPNPENRSSGDSQVPVNEELNTDDPPKESSGVSEGVVRPKNGSGKGSAEITDDRTTQFPGLLENELVIPPSTPQTGFWVPSHPETIVAIDLETFYPWPGQLDVPQPKMADPGVLARKQKRGEAHPYAKDPRRCALRFLTLNIEGEITTHDFFDGPLPGWMAEKTLESTLVGHNLDFDVTVLRRYGIGVSNRLVDTMLAARLLGLGRERGNEDIEDYLDDYADGIPTQIEIEPDPSDNALDAVVQRYLSIQIDPSIARLGNSDWSLPLDTLKGEYIRWDVEHLPALWNALRMALTSANLLSCFQERMEFFPHLNRIKMAGNPIDVALRDSDRDECLKLKTAKREELRELFKDYRPPVPPSRRRKVKGVKDSGVESTGLVMTAPLVETEEFNPNVPSQVVAALGLHGIQVENARKETLERIDTPESRLLIEYADEKAKLSMIDGICRSTFPDGRVRPAGWNQIAARTGRLHSTEPNLQNIPRNWRRAFEAPEPYLWLKIDLSQIEMYIVAILTGCERLIELLAQGKDIYVEVAAEIFGKEPSRGSGPDQVSNELRSVTKTLTLGISYCLGIRSFIKQVSDRTGIIYERPEAQGFYDTFFELFPEIRATHEQAAEDALHLDSVFTVTGQRRFLPPLRNDQDPVSGYWPSLERRKRILVNTPIQGSAANLFIRAVNKFMPLLAEGVEAINLVHDEVDLLVTEGTCPPTIQVVTQSFKEAFGELYSDRLEVKLEHSSGRSWGGNQ